MATKIVRDPLFVFAIIGISVYVGYWLLQKDAQPVIALAADAKAAMANDFTALTGRDATPADIARLEDEFIIDELLFREALKKGLHLTNGEVRAILIEDMRYRVTGVMPDPTQEELVNHYADNLSAYQAEPTITFRHVFFAESAPADAAARLNAGEVLQGDSFLHGAEFPNYGHSMLRGLFGQAFLLQLKEQVIGTWSGALNSELGTHFVLVSRTTEAQTLPFGAVRAQVERDLRQANIDKAIDSALTSLKEDYEISVDN